MVKGRERGKNIFNDLFLYQEIKHDCIVIVRHRGMDDVAVHEEQVAAAQGKRAAGGMLCDGSPTDVDKFKKFMVVEADPLIFFLVKMQFLLIFFRKEAKTEAVQADPYELSVFKAFVTGERVVAFVLDAGRRAVLLA